MPSGTTSCSSPSSPVPAAGRPPPADRVATYAEQGGVSHWMAEMKFGGITHAEAMRSMALFAREVMPRVRERLAKAPPAAAAAGA